MQIQLILDRWLPEIVQTLYQMHFNERKNEGWIDKPDKWINDEWYFNYLLNLLILLFSISFLFPLTLLLTFFLLVC